MISRERLHEHLVLQDQLNSLIHPAWTRQNFGWLRAAFVESAELLDHVGWKWWKHQESDIAQTQLELVDIWHFLLSHELAQSGGDFTEATGNLMHALKSPAMAVYTGYGLRDLSALDTKELIETFGGLAAVGESSISAFMLMMDKLGLTWEALDQQYRAKNVLNIFRQRHGYKDGTYVKQWGDYEDNVALAELMKLKPDASVIQLFEKLESIYSSVTKGTL